MATILQKLVNPPLTPPNGNTPPNNGLINETTEDFLKNYKANLAPLEKIFEKDSNKKSLTYAEKEAVLNTIKAFEVLVVEPMAKAVAEGDLAPIFNIEKLEQLEAYLLASGEFAEYVEKNNENIVVNVRNSEYLQKLEPLRTKVFYSYDCMKGIYKIYEEFLSGEVDDEQAAIESCLEDKDKYNENKIEQVRAFIQYINLYTKALNNKSLSDIINSENRPSNFELNDTLKKKIVGVKIENEIVDEDKLDNVLVRIASDFVNGIKKSYKELEQKFSTNVIKTLGSLSLNNIRKLNDLQQSIFERLQKNQEQKE